MSPRRSRPDRSVLFAFALVLVGGMAVLAALSPGTAPTTAGVAADNHAAHLPHAILGELRAPTSRTPEPTAASTMTAIAPSPEPSPTSVVEDAYVLLQVATYGGLAPDTPFGVDIVRVSPWFGAYAPWDGDGGVVLSVPHTGGMPDRSRLLQADLTATAMEALVDRLANEVEFWDVPEPDETGLCVTDLNTTAVMLREEEGIEGARTRTLFVYGLESYLRGAAPCRPRDATPAPPDPHLVALARFVDDLRTPPVDSRPYTPTRALLVVTRTQPQGDAPAWPLPHDLSDLAPDLLQPRRQDLAADEVGPAMAAVGAARGPGWTMARFSQGEDHFVVGVRPEPPLWWAYGPTNPGATAVHCPPVRPQCTPGPVPTPCSGPGCPTPDPCPCLP